MVGHYCVNASVSLLVFQWLHHDSVSMNINSEVRVNWSMRGSINSIVRQLSRLALDQMSYSVALRGPLWA